MKNYVWVVVDIQEENSFRLVSTAEKAYGLIKQAIDNWEIHEEPIGDETWKDIEMGKRLKTESYKELDETFKKNPNDFQVSEIMWAYREEVK